jgi:tight adherence protein C
MALTFLTWLVLAGAAVALVARAVVMPRIRAAEHLGDIEAYGFPGDGDQAAGGQAWRPPLAGIAEKIGAALSRRLGNARTAESERLLVRAGLYDTSPEAFLGYKALASICASALWLWMASARGTPPGLTILALALTLLAGWILPVSVVRRRGDRRLQQIEYELPELIDLLVVMVEAGVGFAGSLQLAAARLSGPLGGELRLALQEQGMGLSMSAALANLQARCDTPSMRSFVRSVVQGEMLGVSIGDIMRNLAREMRKRRRQTAEERAHKAPTKILFPLVFLIFPAMFVVLLYPALHSLLQSLGGT